MNRLTLHLVAAALMASPAVAAQALPDVGTRVRITAGAGERIVGELWSVSPDSVWLTGRDDQLRAVPRGSLLLVERSLGSGSATKAFLVPLVAAALAGAAIGAVKYNPGGSTGFSPPDSRGGAAKRGLGVGFSIGLVIGSIAALASAQERWEPFGPRAGLVLTLPR